MPASVQVTKDHALPLVVRSGEPVTVYNRYHSDDVVNYNLDAQGGLAGEIKPNKAKQLTLPGTYELTTPTRADVRLIGGGN